MKKRFFIKDRSDSNKNTILTTNRPASIFDFLFDEQDKPEMLLSDNWLLKSRRLQARRWRKFKREAYDN